MMRASNVAERLGIRSVSIVATGFLRQAAAISKSLGIGHALVAEYPGVIPNDSMDTLRQKVREHVVPRVLEGLLSSSQSGQDSEASSEPAMRDVVFSGTYDEVQEYFETQLWTDGLPIVPPTVERVEKFLSYVDRDPAEVLGVLLPENREATVWSVAVNGVMAGCRPEYMPLLLAAVEVISEPEFRIEDAGATPGWEPLVVVSGPMVNEFDFNAGTGLMRIGRRANSTVGRFLRLYMRNVAGLRPPHGATDKGTIGLNFNVAMAEDDSVLQELAWPTLREDLGFSPDETAVLVQSVVAISPPIYTGGSAEEHIDTLAYFLSSTAGPWIFTGIKFQRWHPLLLLSPSAATVLRRAGVDKNALRQALFEKAGVEAQWVDRYSSYVGVPNFSLAKSVNDGLIPPEYLGEDPARRVPVLLRPDWLNIVVAGDPGRNQSKFYINNHEHGPAIARLVRRRGVPT